MKNMPQDILEIIELEKYLSDLWDKRDFYEDIDWLENSEKVRRLYDYRKQLFEALRKTKAIKNQDSSFEPVRNSTIKLINDVLNRTEWSLRRFRWVPKIWSEYEYRQMGMECTIDNPFFFHKLHISDNFDWFMGMWDWMVCKVTKKYLDGERMDDHIRFFCDDNYQFSFEDVEYLVWEYVVDYVASYLCEKTSRITWDRKSMEAKKKWIVSEMKEKYPNATWKCKTFLFSNKSMHDLCSDFLKVEKESILNRIKEAKVLESSENVVNFMFIMCIFLNSYLDSWILNKRFEDYIFMRLENEFRLSEEKRNEELLSQNRSKSIPRTHLVLKDKAVSQKKELPKWMEDDIKNLDIIDDRQLIKFFKVELTKFWWHIKMSHLKDRLCRISEIELLPDILALLDNYPEFSIEDDLQRNSDGVQSESFELDLSDGEEVVEENIQTTLSNKLSEVIQKGDIRERLSWYISIFEMLWFQFRDKDDFLLQLEDAVAKTEKDRLEKSIQVALKFRIYWYESLAKKWAFWYRAICLNYKSWRIVLTNMEITHILPHNEYEKLINTKPS